MHWIKIGDTYLNLANSVSLQIWQPMAIGHPFNDKQRNGLTVAQVNFAVAGYNRPVEMFFFGEDAFALQYYFESTLSVGDVSGKYANYAKGRDTK